MSGTHAGGTTAAITNKQRHGERFYIEIGRLGGMVSSPKKGFGTNRELARTAGAKGGARSKRTAWTQEERIAHGLKIKKGLMDIKENNKSNWLHKRLGR